MAWNDYAQAWLSNGLINVNNKRIKAKKSKPRLYKTLLTDDQVLDIRRQYEFEGVSTETLYIQYKDFKVSKEYLRRLLGYVVRSKLMPKPREK